MTFGARYVARMIADFAARYPDVRMEVDFEDRPVDPVGEGYDVSSGSALCRTVR
tara:strand:- start:2100 stop:2261 length:162 start_codon:yes stop_codon:yes gene_type:complete